MSNKKLMKKVLIISLSATMVFAVNSPVYAGIQALPNGTIVNQNERKYLTDSNGEKYSGWFMDSKENWFYFNESDKAMKTGWHHDDKDGYWYYLNLSDGKMLTGWQTIDGKEYFFQPVRDMGNYDFNNEQEKWAYTLNSKVPYGAMYVNTTTPDGVKVDNTGAKVVITENSNQDTTTEIVKDGWVSQNEKWYYYESGVMVINSWKEIDGNSYYFGSDGVMYVNTTTPDGKKVGENGTKITSINYSDFIGYYSVPDLNQPTTLAENITISKIENGIIYGDFWHSSDGGYEECDFSSGVVLNEDEFDIIVNWEDRGNALVENDDMSGSFQLHVKLSSDSGESCLYIQSNDGPRTAYSSSPRTYNEKLYLYPEF